MNEVVKILKINDIKYNEPLSKHTTFHVGGIAKGVVTPKSKNELLGLITFLNKINFNYKIFGNGSNILPSDEFFDGFIVKTNKALNYLRVEDDIITVGSGYSLKKLAYEMVKYELSGLEFLGGIPGTIGGAVFMNAGAYNREMKDVVLDVTLLKENGEIVVLNNKDMNYCYRKSILHNKNRDLIIETRLKLKKGEKKKILSLLTSRQKRRFNTQPLEYPCAGSTFRNPLNTHAFKLIDQAGLRGYSIGGAKVSCKHCNFVINYNKANSQDILDLVDLIIKKVYLTSKVKLTPEIEFFNWNS